MPVSIHTSRPGFVIGKGVDIARSKIVAKITDSDVNVNIKEIKKPELNSNLVAENIAQQLKKELLPKSNEKSYGSAMRLNAKGIKVISC